ncbi:molybdopterin-dependent oxidoreductase [Sagittula sp. S175]|uniref:molybdopterin-dependent oxidoreductase n=1 Tax=Sagittula sp. S175 TaxID=3415129 RepID=UPI003C7D011F
MIAPSTSLGIAQAALSVWVTFAFPLAADPLARPEGRVILTVTGEIGVTNSVDGTAAEFDLAMLRALGESEIVTDTIWTPDTSHFTGIRLKTLLDLLEADAEKIEAAAINDYRVEIPITDATEDGPILAYAMDGALMSRRDKGPLWLIYPYASSSDYRTEVIYSRSIWQLDRMILGK